MPLLRLTQKQETENDYKVEIAFEDDDGSRLTADVRFPFELTSLERSRLRWYLEDYLQYPLDPAPQIAGDIEAWMEQTGKDLFRAVFEGNEDAREMLPSLRTRLDDTRVEVITDVAGSAAIPWEMLRDPRTDAQTALRAKAFVRGYSKPVQKPYLPKSEEKIRILLVICRPGGEDDVPFRSVASRILKGIGKDSQQAFELDVLRPPTFEQLSRVLREAKAKGQPYHILHFDGHGAYLQSDQGAMERILEQLGALMFSATREGTHGYLLFENSQADKNAELIDGPTLGKLLVETDVPVLVLNACRSAHADIQEEPKPSETGEEHSQIRAFGSLAQEVMDTGVAGVVAMRYNVYVVTAAQFVADLYASLAQGQTLSEAVSMGRKQLAAQPLREVAFEPRPLQDWSVPVVYEAAPIQLLNRAATDSRPPVKIDLSQTVKADDDLPRPDVGFYGRDETILALDHAFDTQQVVLLHAYAGSGKTMTVAEFARWYRDTGGLDGPVLFTSFEQYKPMTQVLSAVEESFRTLFEQNNIQWLAIDENQRLNLTLQIFKQIPALWIWDNVEPINGFPTGTNSTWSLAEQRELKTFLQIVTAQSKTKFLLTSRRDEQAWLGDIPRRVVLPPMPMQERVQLARALAEKQGRRLTEVEDWLPLFKFTKGNPMTLTVLVGQALRDGLKTKAQIYDFIHKLENGEAAFEDEASEGRSKSLGASLGYGFEQAFTEDERKVLALLHFFQGFVNVDVLKLMIADEDWGVGSKEFTREAGIVLLDKASEIGLLTSHGNGYYTIHPALPWFFRSLFEQYYPNELPSPAREGSGVRSARAFVEAVGTLGNYYQAQYEDGNRDVIASLRVEEPNLLRALSLARQHGWWDRVVSAMQGLQPLYDHTGRHAEWKRLVDEIVPDFIGTDDLPFPNREKQWMMVTGYRVNLARKSRDWKEAERLQRLQVNEQHRFAASLLTLPMESLNTSERNTLRSLGISLRRLGEIYRELGQSNCVNAYQDAADILQRIGDNTAAAASFFSLGHAYKDLPTLRNLDESERWYRQCLELSDDNDRRTRGLSLHQLSLVSYERFRDGKRAKLSNEELAQLLNSALDYSHQALATLPPDAVNDLAVAHNQLGGIYYEVNDLEHTLYHSNKCIQYMEIGNDLFGAGKIRRNVALALARNGRLSDALLYARTSLRNFETYGGRAKEDEEITKGLIADIEKNISEQSSNK